MSAGLLSGPRGSVRGTAKCKLHLAVDRVCRLGPRSGSQGGLAAHTGHLSPPELSPTALPAVHSSQCLENPPRRRPPSAAAQWSGSGLAVRSTLLTASPEGHLPADASCGLAVWQISPIYKGISGGAELRGSEQSQSQ